MALTRTNIACIAVAFVAGIVLVNADNIAAAADSKGSDAAVLKQVVEAWQQRRKQVQSVRYVVKGTVIVPKGTFDGDRYLPRKANGVALTQDYEHEYSGRWLVDFANKKFRIKIDSATFNLTLLKFLPTADLFVFDGNEVRCQLIGVTENRGTHYSVLQPEFRYHKLDYPVITMEQFPIFAVHGVILDGAGRAGLPRHFHSQMPRNRFTVHSRVTLQDRECVVLRSLPVDDHDGNYLELWVDLARHSSIVRARKFEGRMLRNYVDIDYRETPQGWYLKGWRFTKIGFEKKVPVKIVTATVQDFKLDSPGNDNDFELNPAIGMVVRDDHTNTAYLLGANGEHLPIRETLLGDTNAHNRWFAAATLVIVIVLIVAFIVVRRRFRRASDNS